MALHYDKTYSRGGYNVTIVVTMRTGSVDLGGGKMVPTNTIAITHWDESETTYPDIRDEHVELKVLNLQDVENKYIDGTPCVALNAALIANGFTKTID